MHFVSLHYFHYFHYVSLHKSYVPRTSFHTKRGYNEISLFRTSKKKKQINKQILPVRYYMPLNVTIEKIIAIGEKKEKEKKNNEKKGRNERKKEEK